MKRNFVLDGMMGLIVGDALGVPVQFFSRDEIAYRSQGPVVDMEGFGTFNLPAGSWSDDSSMSLATLDSMKIHGGIDLDDIMLRFINWNYEGTYTPHGRSFDQGRTCLNAIDNYMYISDVSTCGVTGEYANGNGALMRILPVCLFNVLKNIATIDAVENVHAVTALTHNHLRSQICSGFYYFIVKKIIQNAIADDKDEENNSGRTSKKSLEELVQEGIDEACSYYEGELINLAELSRLYRIYNLNEFKTMPVEAIKSTGYVIDTLEAAIWCLITTDSLEACLLKAVNLGDDTDTVAAVAGGLAGLFYGYESIPDRWLSVIAKRDWIDAICTLDYENDFPIADIHIHAVDKVDDGSSSLEMSLEMIDNEYRQGVRTIVLTSHDWGLGRDFYNERFDNIVKLCAEKYADLRLLSGNEIYCGRDWMDKILEELKCGIIHTMNNTEYVLVEFDKHDIGMDNIVNCCERLKENGYIPIIAHAERYYDVFEGIDSVKELRTMGCLIQINAYSIANESNVKAKSLAREILSEKLADFLGSDAHRMNHRPPQMADGVAWLIKNVDKDYAEAIAYKNAEKMLGI